MGDSTCVACGDASGCPPIMMPSALPTRTRPACHPEGWIPVSVCGFGCHVKLSVRTEKIVYAEGAMARQSHRLVSKPLRRRLIHHPPPLTNRCALPSPEDANDRRSANPFTLSARHRG